jgi:hypothetical protein
VLMKLSVTLSCVAGSSGATTGPSPTQTRLLLPVPHLAAALPLATLLCLVAALCRVRAPPPAAALLLVTPQCLVAALSRVRALPLAARLSLGRAPLLVGHAAGTRTPTTLPAPEHLAHPALLAHQAPQALLGPLATAALPLAAALRLVRALPLAAPQRRLLAAPALVALVSAFLPLYPQHPWLHEEALLSTCVLHAMCAACHAKRRCSVLVCCMPLGCVCLDWSWPQLAELCSMTAPGAWKRCLYVATAQCCC